MRIKTTVVLLLSIIFSLSFAGSAMAGTHHVYPGDSIQAAVNNASDDLGRYCDDTGIVIIHNGVYVENVIAHTPGLEIIGDGCSGYVRVSAADRHRDVFNICGDVTLRNKCPCRNFIISGATRNGAAGVNAAWHTTIENLTLTGNENGLIVRGEGNEVRNLNISDNDDGIIADGWVKIYNSFINNSRKVGISFEHTECVKVQDTKISNSGKRGVEADGSEGLFFSRVTVTGSGKDGFDLTNIYGLSIDDCIVTDNGKNGISIDGAADWGITNSFISDNGRAGLYLQHSDGGDVADNEFAFNTKYGMKIMYTNGVTFENNDAHDNGKKDIKEHDSNNTWI